MRVENALKNPFHREVLYILARFQEKKVGMMHLRFLLIENHDGIMVTTKNGRLTREGRKLRDTFGVSFSSEGGFFYFDLCFGGLLDKKIVCRSCRNFLSKIVRELRFTHPYPLVRRVPPVRGGRATYVLTCEGEIIVNKMLLNWLIDSFDIPVEVVRGMVSSLLQVVFPEPVYGVEW